MKKLLMILLLVPILGFGKIDNSNRKEPHNSEGAKSLCTYHFAYRHADNSLWMYKGDGKGRTRVLTFDDDLIREIVASKNNQEKAPGTKQKVDLVQQWNEYLIDLKRQDPGKKPSWNDFWDRYLVEKKIIQSN